VDPAVWLEQAFGHDDKGRAYGGGRRDKGGFRIPIGFLGRSTDRTQLWTLVEHAMRTALLRQLGDEGPANAIVQHPPTQKRED
jgi:nanoRNase/pAp phosphatase (c-di-AMP/oligoRNAs hydrolase)